MNRGRRLSLAFAIVLSLSTPPVKAETGRNCNDGADNIVGESTPSTVSDDFSGPKKNAPDSYLWGYDTGADWPNAELQTYTKSVNNASTDGEGHLVITALKTSVGYSSARLKTQGNLDMGYGRVEASIQMPPGPNVLPAFWLLDSNYPSVGGAACGEIDIIEYVQGACHFTLHGPQQGEEDYRPPGRPAYSGVSRDWTPPFDPSQSFHTYWVDRSPGEITLGVDSFVSYTFTPDSLPERAQWVFDDRPMFAIMSLAVGGGWAGDPTNTVEFPQQMVVDWFRFIPS